MIVLTMPARRDDGTELTLRLLIEPDDARAMILDVLAQLDDQDNADHP